MRVSLVPCHSVPTSASPSGSGTSIRAPSRAGVGEGTAYPSSVWRWPPRSQGETRQGFRSILGARIGKSLPVLRRRRENRYQLNSELGLLLARLIVLRDLAI